MTYVEDTPQPQPPVTVKENTCSLNSLNKTSSITRLKFYT